MLCPVCRAENNNTDNECVLCGAELSSGSQADVAAGLPKITLINFTTKERIEIPPGGGIIGRNCDFAPEAFNHNWVSDVHCRIYVLENECYIEDVGSSGKGSTNGTKLNGNPLVPRQRFKFINGNTITIAHLVFDVEIKYAENNVVNNGEINITTETVWVIVCPVCGREYVVENESTVINECEVCEDRMDKRRISSLKPKMKTL